MMMNNEVSIGLIKRIMKRCFDIFFSFVGLLFFLPLLIITAILVKMTSSGPVIYRQERIGKDGIIFTIYKFRTMHDGADKRHKLITVGNDDRITKTGKYLRKFKIDELPQLINVLNGTMSFVGPRPEVEKYVDMYNKNQRRVLLIKPGITDYASIKFRNESELLGQSDNPEKTYVEVIMPKKIELNLKYVSEMSFLTDIKIIIITIFAVLFR